MFEGASPRLLLQRALVWAIAGGITEELCVLAIPPQAREGAHVVVFYSVKV